MVRAETQKTECTSYALQRNKNLSAYQNTPPYYKISLQKIYPLLKILGET